MNYTDEVRTHTALHLLKGSVVRVLGPSAMWTAGVYVNGKHGRLTVRFNKAPSPEEIKLIEDLTNKKIAEDLKIEIKVMSRKEAESNYGNIIYDLFPIPDEVQTLHILIVYDTNGEIWNINACNKQHTISSRDIGKIKIGKVRFRASKELLEIPFDVEP